MNNEPKSRPIQDEGELPPECRYFDEWFGLNGPNEHNALFKGDRSYMWTLLRNMCCRSFAAGEALGAVSAHPHVSPLAAQPEPFPPHIEHNLSEIASVKRQSAQPESQPARFEVSRFCLICGYPAYKVNNSERYAHDLPNGRSYTDHKEEFPQCWNDAKVVAPPSSQVAGGVGGEENKC